MFHIIPLVNFFTDSHPLKEDLKLAQGWPLSLCLFRCSNFTSPLPPNIWRSLGRKQTLVTFVCMLNSWWQVPSSPKNSFTALVATPNGLLGFAQEWECSLPNLTKTTFSLRSSTGGATSHGLGRMEEAKPKHFLLQWIPANTVLQTSNLFWCRLEVCDREW